MIKVNYQKNGTLKIFLNRKNHERIAAYLYRRDQCIEKIMYSDNDSLVFSERIEEGILYHIVGYIRDIQTGVIKTTDKIYFYYLNGHIKSITSNILFESDDVLIKHYDQQSNIIFITFLGTKTTKKTKPFALNFAIENGWNCIAVHQDNDTQYQGLSEMQFYEAVKESIKDKKVYMYGVSLGGYCAIYYAGIINATVIAGSPKNSAHPKYLVDKFKGLKFSHKNISEISHSKENVIILYDPYQSGDVSFINNEILPSYPHAYLVSLPWAGHKVLESLAEYKLLKNYIVALVNSSDYFLTNNQLLKNYLDSKAK